jgi:NAD(P)-dependent dehydrogenase (short-subunit alcohol dehydrogenase family)
MSIAIVTGGSGTIGSVICATLASRGDRVLCADLKESTFSTAFADLPAAQRANIEFAALDVTQADSWNEICERADGGNIGTLVNAAFSATLGPIDRLDHDAWRGCFDVIVHGAALGIQTVGNHMAAHGGGAIVNIASVVAHAGAPMNAGYATAKAALLGLTRTAAARLGRKGVTVNAISPGWVESPAVHGLFKAQTRGGKTLEEVRSAFVSAIPLQRLAQPQDIAQSVAFLSSDGARYITGIELTVDGGLGVA